MRGFFPSVVVGALFLVSCTDFPDLDDVITDQARQGGFPVLVPIDGLLPTTAQDFEQAKTEAKNLVARARALRQRAQALRGPVIDARTRYALARAQARHPIAKQE